MNNHDEWREKFECVKIESLYFLRNDSKLHVQKLGHRSVLVLSSSDKWYVFTLCSVQLISTQQEETIRENLVDGHERRSHPRIVRFKISCTKWSLSEMKYSRINSYRRQGGCRHNFGCRFCDSLSMVVPGSSTWRYTERSGMCLWCVLIYGLAIISSI